MTEPPGLESPSLLGLPYEIRLKIFEMVLNNRVFWINFDKRLGPTIHYKVLPNLTILGVNKQTREEGLQVCKVRKLHINRYEVLDIMLLWRIPLLLSRWKDTIEVVLIAIDQRTFEVLLGRHPEVRWHSSHVALRRILEPLPNLNTVILTCNVESEYRKDQHLADQLSRCFMQLTGHLPGFDRIHIEMSRKQDLASQWGPEEIEVKLSKHVAKVPQSAVPDISHDTVRQHQTKLSSVSIAN